MSGGSQIRSGWRKREPSGSLRGSWSSAALGVLSQHLVVLLGPAAVVATMHDAYGRIDFAASPYGVFMAGPSATGDIKGVIISSPGGSEPDRPAPRTGFGVRGRDRWTSTL